MNKKLKVKTHKKAKTERVYDYVSCASELCRAIENRGDRVLFSFFTFDHRLCDITYAEFGKMIKSVAAGLTSLGYAGKRIAVIGETSPEWLCMYLAILSVGGVAIPMDRELAPSEIEKFLDWVEADGISYAPSLENTMNKLRETTSRLSIYIPFAGDVKKYSVISFGKLCEIGAPSVEAGFDYPDFTGRENELAEFLFTSGTTGSSKCVMLSWSASFSGLQ